MPAPPKGSKGDEATVAWIRERFRRHYRTATLELPPRFTRREYGFMFFHDERVIRHRGFGRSSELRDFLLGNNPVREVPRHAYFSSAYYETPGAPTMEEKGWLGADLVFDLDADHIDRVKGMPYEAMLEEVKGEIARIVDEYLLADFGFAASSLLITFSGGRGYHIHVRDPKVWELQSHERREIVDYITGTELDVSQLVKRKAIAVKQWGDRATVKYTHLMPQPEGPGWPGRFARGVVETVRRMQDMPRDEAQKILTKVGGASPKFAAELYEVLFGRHGGLSGADKIRGGVLDIFPEDRYLAPFRNIMEKEAVDLGKRETDEPVTSDIKRLIRMPGSLHGKTGLEVVPLTRSELDGFVPLRDAIPEAWTDEPVRLRLRTGIKITMRDETFNLGEGVNSVPEYLAIFLACRGVASIAA